MRMGDALDDLTAGLDLHRAGRGEAAETHYRRVLERDPAQPTALLLLGLLLLGRPDAPGAVAMLVRADAARPGHLATLMALADAHAGAGCPVPAEAGYRAVLARWPGHLAGLVNLARLLCVLRRWAEALETAALAVASHPMAVDSWLVQAGAALNAGLADRALLSADTAISLVPDSAEGWFLRGTALRRLGRAGSAVDALGRAIILAPLYPEARINLANAHADLDETELAESMLRNVLAIDRTRADAWSALAVVLTVQGRLKEAVAACDASLALRPGDAKTHWARGVAHLLAGDYAHGWADHEWRRRLPAAGALSPHGVEWRGEDLRGRSILVHASEGLGDTIQFCRFLAVLRQRGADVGLVCSPRLVGLLRQLPVRALAADGSLPPADFHLDLMSLAGRLQVTPDTLAAGPYLHARARTFDCRGFRVGLAWAGNPAHRNDARRSIPAEMLAPILCLPGIEFVGLQQDAVHPGLPRPPMPDLADAAAVVAGLDLVISVDSCIAHLAGALGRPTWTLLPHAPDWRWMLGRADTPWYASMRLFRQPRPGDWPAVVADVAAALGALYAARVGQDVGVPRRVSSCAREVTSVPA
jgi:tetratricopeptide (TPR) repeat protein